MQLPVGRDVQRAAVRGMQAVIAVLFVAGLGLRSPALVVNAGLSLAVTFLPAVLARDYRLHLGPGVTLWVTTALCLHSIGMVGLYHAVWWWDHLTHALSATLVAAVGYTAVRAIDNQTEALALPPGFMFVFLLLFTIALGVLWEVLEFAGREVTDLLGADPVLVIYGLEDSLMDIVFDAVGALLVAAFGTRELGGLVEAVERRLEGPRAGD